MDVCLDCAIDMRLNADVSFVLELKLDDLALVLLDMLKCDKFYLLLQLPETGEVLFLLPIE